MIVIPHQNASSGLFCPVEILLKYNIVDNVSIKIVICLDKYCALYNDIANNCVDLLVN